MSFQNHIRIVLESYKFSGFKIPVGLNAISVYNCCNLRGIAVKDCVGQQRRLMKFFKKVKAILERKKPHLALLLLLYLVSFLIGMYLPDTVPLHWHQSGMVDRYGTKYELLLLLPASATVVFIVGLAAEARYVRPSDKTKSFMSFLQLFFLMVFAIIQLTRLFRAQNIYLRQESFLTIPVALLFVYAANATKDAEYLSDFGFKTKWTTKSRYVWNRTNRLAAILFFTAAVLMLIPVFLPDLFYGMLFLLVGATITVLVLYSYIISRNDRGDNDNGNPDDRYAGDADQANSVNVTSKDRKESTRDRGRDENKESTRDRERDENNESTRSRESDENKESTYNRESDENKESTRSRESDEKN